MLKREWGAESNGKLPHLLILSKSVTLVSEFDVEDLPLRRTATLVPIYRPIPIVLYGCETWSLTLSEEHRLWMFENKIRLFRKVFSARGR